MAVLDAVDTFAGIANENEFYSHHYLAEVFKGDIKSRLETWDANEALHPGTESERAPAKRLSSWSQKWFSFRNQIDRAREDAEKWQIFTQLQTGLLQALGYSAPGKTTPMVELVPGQPLPLWQLLAKGGLAGQSAAAAMLPSQLAIVPAYQPGAEDEDLLDHQAADSALRWRATYPPRSRASPGHPCFPKPSSVPNAPALCAAAGPGPLAAAGPLQMAQQPGTAFRLG
jgi:hypothetical protein